VSNERTRKPLRLAVLVSGSGTNLQALIDAQEQGELPGAQIALVVCNIAAAEGLQRALKHKIPAIYLPWGKNRELAEQRLHGLLQIFNIDLIVLAGWMRIFNPAFTQQYPRRIINQHPSLLPLDGVGTTVTTSDGTIIPALRGIGHQVVSGALEAGLKVTGGTVHYVIPEVDAGPVICQAEVPILADDTEETLHERIKVAERHLIVQAVRELAREHMQ
jgi:phosphoribosylglycinamide formyltransferase-1